MSVETAAPERTSTMAASAAQTRARPSWRRFSLRTLLLLTLLLGSAGSLWAKWSPWRLEQVVTFKTPWGNAQYDYAGGSGVLDIDYRGPDSVWIDAATRTAHALDYPRPVLWPVFFNDEKRFATAHADNTLVIRDKQDARALKALPARGGTELLDALCARKTPRLYVLLRGELVVYDALTYATLQRQVLELKDSADHCLVLTKDETLLLIYHKNAIDVFDAGTLQPVSSIAVETPVNNADRTFDSHSHGPCVVAYDNSSAAYGVYTLRTGKLAFSLPAPAAVTGTQISRDGTRLVVHATTEIRILDSDTGREVQKIPVPGSHWRAYCTDDGAHVFLASNKGEGTQIWDAHSGAHLASLRATIDPHRFSPDGRSCQSVDYDIHNKEVRLLSWRKIRDEARWGALELPEFWLAALLALLALAVLGSLIRDWRDWRAAAR